MKVDGNIQAIRNIGTMQQVSANNLANVNSDGFTPSRTVQQGDRISISPDARAAGAAAKGVTGSGSDVGGEFARMGSYGSALEANIKAIRTQEAMQQALLSLKEQT